MFCSSCGHNIPDDSVFCPECGSRLGAARQQSGTVRTTETTEVSSGLNIGVIVASLIVPLVGLVMGVIYLRDDSPEKKRAGKVWLWVGAGAALFWILASV